MIPLHEDATVRAFVTSARRMRWLESLASEKRRRAFLGRLDHCRDFDERYASTMPSNADIVAELFTRGAPADCHVMSSDAALDGQTLPLVDAVTRTHLRGSGTIISCVPGRLAYYCGESGERHLLLERQTD